MSQWKINQNMVYLLKNAVFTRLQVISYSLSFFNGETLPFAVCDRGHGFGGPSGLMFLNSQSVSGSDVRRLLVKSAHLGGDGQLVNRPSIHWEWEGFTNGFRWFNWNSHFVSSSSSLIRRSIAKRPQNVKDPNCCLDSIPNHVVTWVCLFLKENVSALFWPNSVLTLWYSYAQTPQFAHTHFLAILKKYKFPPPLNFTFNWEDQQGD